MIIEQCSLVLDENHMNFMHESPFTNTSHTRALPHQHKRHGVDHNMCVQYWFINVLEESSSRSVALGRKNNRTQVMNIYWIKRWYGMLLNCAVWHVRCDKNSSGFWIGLICASLFRSRPTDTRFIALDSVEMCKMCAMNPTK